MNSKKNICCVMSLLFLFGTQWATTTSVTLCTLTKMHKEQNHEQKLKKLPQKFTAWTSCKHAFCKLCLHELCYQSNITPIKCPACHPDLWAKKSLQEPFIEAVFCAKDPVVASLFILLVGIILWSW